MSGSPSTLPYITILTEAHTTQVALLETLCFPQEPWSQSALQVLCRAHGTGIVATDRLTPTDEPTVLAYVGMTYAADEGAITNVATHPDARRRGYGRLVVKALMEKAVALGLSAIYLEVRPSNAAAIALYEALGFQIIGKRKNFYRFPTEDGFVMKAELSPHASGVSEICPSDK